MCGRPEIADAERGVRPNREVPNPATPDEAERHLHATEGTLAPLLGTLPSGPRGRGDRFCSGRGERPGGKRSPMPAFAATPNLR